MAERLKTLLLQGPSGLHYLTNSELAYASVITVKRNGVRQYQVESTPTGLEPKVYHESSTGKLIWSTDRPFNSTELDEFGARIIEYVHVIYTGGSFEIIDAPPIEVPEPPTTYPPIDPPPVDESGEDITMSVQNATVGGGIDGFNLGAGIPGFGSPSVTAGNTVSGSHTAFTDTIQVNFAFPTINTSVLNLFVNGSLVETITKPAGDGSDVTFSSRTYALTDIIFLIWS